MPLRFELAAGLIAAMVLALPATGRAERLAVLLGNHDYTTQPDLPGGAAFDRMAGLLDAAGFATVTLEGLSPPQAIDRLDRLRDRIGAADRLVIVVSGHVLRAGREAWLLGPRAGAVTSLSVGAAAVPLGPLMDMAAQSPGRAILAVADERRQTERGAGTEPFSAPDPVPQGVTVLVGPPEALVAAMTRALRQDLPLAEAVTGERQLRASGYLPRHGSFLAAPGAARVDREEEDIPAPIDVMTPQERRAQQEAALRLDVSDRRRVQRALAILGHDPRGIDGVFGAGTRAAIRSWQAAEGLPQSGYLESRQLERLLVAADARAAALEQEAAARQAEADVADRDYWRDTGRGGDEVGLRAYLDRYPDGLFAGVARERLREIEDARRAQVPVEERAAWDRAAGADTAEAYRDYLDAYPGGAFAEDARQRLADREEDEAERDRSAELLAQEQAVAGNPVLRRLVETRLENLGHPPGAVDGQFDEETRRALRRFQQARGLPATGYVDQATMVRLLIGG